MPNDPYSAAADFNEHYADSGPPRTSVLAILSLVLSLICFIPGLSAIGSLLGVFALLGISASKGRVKGTGLAIAGIAVGLVISLLWIGGAVAIQQGSKQYLKMNDILADVESGSYDAARGYLSSSTRPLATDEAFETFKAAYLADAGAYQGDPQGLWQLLKTFGEIGQNQDPNTVAKPYGGNQAPVPGIFLNGPRWVFVGMSSTGEQNAAGTFIALDNVAVWLSDGTMLWLVDPAVQQAGTPPAGVNGSGDPAQAPTDEEASPEAPAAEPETGEGG